MWVGSASLISLVSLAALRACKCDVGWKYGNTYHSNPTACAASQEGGKKFFRRIKVYCHVFTRYDKLDIMYFSFVQLAIICQWRDNLRNTTKFGWDTSLRRFDRTREHTHGGGHGRPMDIFRHRTSWYE